MATKVPQRTPRERLLDARIRYADATFRVPRRFHFERRSKAVLSFDYCACVRLLRLHIIAVEVYCHVCHCQSHLLYSLGG